MEQKQYLKASLKKQEDGKIIFIASDETLDRQGDVLPLESWDLKNYKSNPVLLVDHEYCVANIVGSAKGIKIDSKIQALTFEPSFHEITQLSKDVKAMVESGDLNTVSVGFMPIYPKKDGDKIKLELLEISFVAVPANPSALALRGLDLEQAEIAIKSFVDESKEVEEVVVKEGRTISKKTRTMLTDVVSAMAKAVETIGELIATTDAEDEVKTVDGILDDLSEAVGSSEEKTFTVDKDVLQMLINDSEKLKTLTGVDSKEVKVVNQDEQLENAKMFLKAIAREVNGALCLMNKREKDL